MEFQDDEQKGEKDQEKILGDYFVIKQEIFSSYFAFLDELSNLLVYEHINKGSRRTYLAVIKNLYRTVSKIGSARFKKFLSEDEFLDYQKINTFLLTKEKMSFLDFDQAKEMLNSFMSNSKMDSIEIEEQDQRNSWRQN